jgi:predicted nucleic acid-binding protein
LAIKWVINERYSLEATRLLREWQQTGLRPCSPQLLAYEATSVLRVRVFRGQLTTDDAKKQLTALLRMGPTLVTLQPTTHRRALEIADMFGLEDAYDAQYVALAENMKCDLWTADHALVRAVAGAFPWVHGISERRGIT